MKSTGARVSRRRGSTLSARFLSQERYHTGPDRHDDRPRMPVKNHIQEK